MNKNGEGYVDPTPGAAFGNIRREEHKREADRLSVISNLIPIMKNTAELAGFEVVGRIVLKDKHTGKEYRYNYEKAYERCQKKMNGKNSNDDIGEDAMALAVKYGGNGKKKSEKSDSSDSGGKNEEINT